MFNNKYTLKTHQQLHESDSRPIKSHSRINQPEIPPFENIQKALEAINNLFDEIDATRKTYQTLDTVPAANEVQL